MHLPDGSTTSEPDRKSDHDGSSHHTDKHKFDEVPCDRCGGKQCGGRTVCVQFSSVNKEMPDGKERSDSGHMPVSIYIGVDLSREPATESDHEDGPAKKGCRTGNAASFALYIHDASFILDYYSEDVDLNGFGGESDKNAFLLDAMIDSIRGYARKHSYKVAGVGLCKDSFDGTKLADLTRRLWLELDVIPFMVEAEGESIDERAESAVRKCVEQFSPAGLPRMQLDGTKLRIDPSFVRICDLEDYRRTVPEVVWDACYNFARKAKKNGARIRIFNATPQGGGVALMRHSNVRFFRMQGLDVAWHVPKPNPAVFRITKNCHNLLQGAVSDDDATVTDEDLAKWDQWLHENYERHWKDVVREGDVYIIDDPQVSGLVPLIRKANPTARIIFRSHIELRSDLIKRKGSQQSKIWSHILASVKDADIVISHPVKSFLPDGYPLRRTLLMPATTDPLDGLNKPLEEDDVTYYLKVMERTCLEQERKDFSWRTRDYIIQVARFDPAKGLPDCVEAYRLFREAVKNDLKGDDVPQLLLCGHGAVDDPDDAVVYNQVQEQLGKEQYKDIASDVLVARLPASDVLLNALMRGSKFAMQLSHQEGFEVKITEALMKGKPVIAYRVGGIPLQIADGKTGFLVPVGDVKQVAQHMQTLVMADRPRSQRGGSGVYERVKQAAKHMVSADTPSSSSSCHASGCGGNNVYECMAHAAAADKERWTDFLAVTGAANWLYLATAEAEELWARSSRQDGDEEFDEHPRWVRELWWQSFAGKAASFGGVCGTILDKDGDNSTDPSCH
ncbi:hypothetical protein RI367_008675 [Sorochytrium milnesiophthora]